MEKIKLYRYIIIKFILFMFLLGTLLCLEYLLEKKEDEYEKLANKVSITSNNSTELVADVFMVDVEINNIQTYTNDTIYKYLIKIDTDNKIFKVIRNGEEEVLNLNDEEAYVEIGANESFIIKDIPIDVRYTIIQENDNIPSVDNNLTNTYEGITTLSNKVYFYNTKTFISNPNTDDSIFKVFCFFILMVLLNFILYRVKVRPCE